MSLPFEKNRRSRFGSSASERGGIIGWLLGLLVILLLVGIILFALYRNGWSSAKINTGSVRDAISSVEDASKDAMTTTKVKTALALSKDVSAFKVDVDSDNGTVILNGRVPSDRVKQLAGEISRQTAGVRTVRNNLVVDPSTKPNPEMERLGNRVADLELKTKINESIAKDGNLNKQDVRVDVSRLAVTLNGRVNSAEQKYRAERHAWGFSEVKQVNNRLAVQEDPAAEHPDDKLARRVEFELYSTRSFDLDPINIRSSSGTVILSGRVRNNAERVLAEKIAERVDGVKSVKNHLTVPVLETTAEDLAAETDRPAE